MKSNYKYQNDAAEITLEQVLTNQFIAGVIGACPGAGKTTISHIIINDYVRMFPNSRILVLAHNTNVLKDQYLEDTKHSNVQLNFEFGEFRTDAQVRIGIPASIHHLDWETVDLLVVDEAHEYWGQDMVTAIYKKLSPKHVILLTGSPSSFIEHNKAVDTIYKGHKKYFIHVIAGESIKNFAPVTLNTLPISGTTRERFLASFEYAKDMGYNTDKIMVACKSIEESEIVGATLKSMGRNVVVSHSKNDKKSEGFQLFKDGEKDALVVVDKGILGFSDNNLTLMMDMKCSSDLDTRNQLFSRILRKHPDGIRKAYLSVPKANKRVKEVQMLERLLKMQNKMFFGSYIG